MSVTIVMTPASEKSWATSDARRTDSPRSDAEKPRSRVRPVLRLSPSMLKTFLPSFRSRCFSRALEIVVFPEPERPVIHKVTPFWLSTLYRFTGDMRHESSFASAEHSMIFAATPRESIVSRWRAATTMSASGVGQLICAWQTGHCGVATGGGHSRDVGHDGQPGKSGHLGHVGHLATAASTAFESRAEVSGIEHAGHAGQRAAAARATWFRSAQG
mmetsp:Transcript_18879/g.38412  ORF Transcript_18879/g.38412 Transcript_18879/m.38412 type:complete len:216 (+) Transcript_18879:2819-3466(+)